MSRNRSWVWQHFTRLSEDLANCSVCGSTLTCSYGSTTGLGRHLRTHGIVQEKKIEEVVEEISVAEIDIKMENIDEGEFLVERLIQEEEPKERRSWVWNYFTKYSDSNAKCTICEKFIRCVGSSTSGMAFHLSKHGLSESDVGRLDTNFEDEQFEAVDETFEDAQDTSADILGPEDDSSKGKRSWVWNHFIKISSLFARCGICHKEIGCKESSTSGMRTHLRSHNLTETSTDAEGEQRTEKRPSRNHKLTLVTGSKNRSWVWSYFKKVSRSTSKCDICSRLINCSGASTSGMRNHLKTHNMTEAIHNEGLIPTAEESHVEFARESPEKKRRQQCHVCDEAVGAFGTPLDTSLEFTNVSINELLASFGLDEPTKNSSTICLECLSSLKRYDEFQHHCQVIQSKITNMYHKTHSERIFIVKEGLEGEQQAESLDENNEDVFQSSQESAGRNFLTQRETSELTFEFKKQECAPIPRTNAVYQCDKCSKSFSVRSRMIRHLKSHRRGNRSLACVKCSQICRSDFHLQTHVIIEHSTNPEGPFECPTCFKVFSSKHQLKKHYYHHKPDKNWLCIL